MSHMLGSTLKMRCVINVLLTALREGRCADQLPLSLEGGKILRLAWATE